MKKKWYLYTIGTKGQKVGERVPYSLVADSYDGYGKT